MGERWYIYVSVGWTEFEYGLPNTVFGVLRNDRQWSGALRFTRELVEHWNLYWDIRVTDHASNIPFFDYDRLTASVGVETRY